MKRRFSPKIKRALAVLLSAMLILSALPFAALADDNGTCGDNATWTFESATGTLTISGTGEVASYSGESDVPWNDLRSSITSVIIENGITYTGAYVFSNSAVSNVQLPSSLLTIGASSFNGCSNLTSITIPDNVTSIQGLAFYNCSSIQSVYCDSLEHWCNISFTSGGNSAYVFGSGSDAKLYIDNTEVSNLVIPDGVINIPEYAFQNCKSITGVSLSSSVTTIGQYAFEGCTNINTLTLNECLQNIRNRSFSHCSGITSLTIPESVININNTAFEYCTGLNSVTFSNCAAKLYNQVFSHCENLTNVDLGNSITSIGSEAFQYCSKLESIVIPQSVTSIGARCFASCSSMNSATILNAECVINTNAFYSSAQKLYGLQNSTAQTYAEENNIEFAVVCSDGTENHNMEETSNTATCTEAGIKTSTCSICGYVLEEEQAAIGHSFTNYVSDENATCTEDGTKTATCDNGCGETDTVTDESTALGHNYESEVIAPTCTDQGYTHYTCTRCDDAYDDTYVDAVGHSYKAEIIEPTSLDKGYTRFTCINCGETYIGDFTDALGYQGVTETSYDRYRIVPCYGQIKVAWNIDTNIEGYEVYASTERNGDYQLIADIKTADGNHYIIDTLASGRLYYVYLIGYNTFEGERIKMNTSPVKAIMVK